MERSKPIFIGHNSDDVNRVLEDLKAGCADGRMVVEIGIADTRALDRQRVHDDKRLRCVGQRSRPPVKPDAGNRSAAIGQCNESVGHVAQRFCRYPSLEAASTHEFQIHVVTNATVQETAAHRLTGHTRRPVDTLEQG